MVFHFFLLAQALSFTLLDVVFNDHEEPSLINSVDFDPTSEVFAATFTHNQEVRIYRILEGKIALQQVIQNPKGELKYPQHALISKDGKWLIVANWEGQTLNGYSKKGSQFSSTPSFSTSFGFKTKRLRPHGMAFSPDGKRLALAFGASTMDAKGIGFYTFEEKKGFKPDYYLKRPELKEGIPKGVTFSPDGKSLLVTIADTHCLVVYDLNNLNEPKKVLQGLSRPEDVRFSADGTYFAVTNSGNNTVSFYNWETFDLKHVIDNLKIPHGLGFSPDGQSLVISQFGNVAFSKNGYIESWDEKREEGLILYKIQ
ncbi:MAG: WD40 repeat domain-containing protein [Chlamydiia bacterium]|nr:WD40 repeat domain-containing protein [Chlamydiia bacterium]